MIKKLNPIGTPQQIAEVEQFIAQAIQKWHTDVQKISYWRFWDLKTAKTDLTIFFLECLDGLINIMAPLAMLTADKKATVISAMSKIYDLAIATSLPVFLKPFNPTIKAFVIDVVLVVMIDWIVQVYNQNGWSQEIKDKINQLENDKKKT